jgi:preprotein translocase subunit SecD
MNRLTAVVALALVAILVAGCGGSRKCTGTEVTLRAIPPHGQQVTTTGMQTAQQIITQRLSTLGVSSPTVSLKGSDEIVVHFAGVHDPVDVAKVAFTPGRLQVFDFEPSLAPPTVTHNQQPAPLPSLYAVLESVQKEAAKGSPQAYYLFKTSASHPVVQGPAPTLHDLFLSYKDGKQPPHTRVLAVPANREAVRCSGIGNCPGASNESSKTGRSWYLLKLPPAVTGKDLRESGIAAEIDPSSGQPIVTLGLTRQGTKAFQQITRAEYDRGRVNAGEAGQLADTNQSAINEYAGHNAVVLDGQLEETPYIDYTDAALSDGIGGSGQLVMPSAAVAKRTALILRTGSLAYTFEPIGQKVCPRSS